MTIPHRTPPWAILTVWWIACLAWSGTFLFIRLGLREIPPLTFASARLAIALAILAPLAAAQVRRTSIPRWEWARLSATGLLLLGVNYALLYWGAQFIPSGLTAILQAMTPVFALGLGWLLGSEEPTKGKLLGLTVGFAGLFVIFGAEARLSGPRAITGSAAVLGGAFCVALAYVTVKTYSIRLPPAVVMTIQIGVAVVPMAAAALLFEGIPPAATWSASAWLALLYLALVGSVGAFWLNYWLLQRIDTSPMLMMGIAEVPIAILLGAAFLTERLAPATLAGAALILAGVLAMLPRRQAEAARE